MGCANTKLAIFYRLIIENRREISLMAHLLL